MNATISLTTTSIYRQELRFQFMMLCGIAILLILIVYSLMVGPIPLSFHNVIKYFSGSATQTQTIILSDIRIPRTLTAIISGAALSVSGLLLQTVTRNTLACPTLLGISNGSALTALVVLLWIPTININLYFLIVLIGGLLSFALIYIFSMSKKLSMARLILVGATFNALFYGVAYLLLVIFPDRAQSLLFVLNGSIAGVHLTQSLYLTVITIVSITIAWVFRHKLQMLAASTDTLNSLGIAHHKLSLLFIFLAVLLSSSVASVIGPVFFFGLIAPHILRLILGKNTSQLLIASALLGAILMLATDLFMRFYFSGFEVSISIIFAFLSAPLLVILLRVAKL